MTEQALRPELPPLPDKIKALPVDARGYPVPFFVAWIDGKPDHRVVDPRRKGQCVVQNICWICGQPLGTYKVFAFGPLSAINRCSGEPPSHYDCAEFAAKACPWLTRPKATRRENDLPPDAEFVEGHADYNPGIVCLWTTKQYTPLNIGGDILFYTGRAERLTWLCEGQPATKQQVIDAIERAVPILLERAKQEGNEAVTVARKRIIGMATAIDNAIWPQTAPAS